MLDGKGTVPGTCNPGTPGCKQGFQCQTDAEGGGQFPQYHIIGNFTTGNGTRPASINDVSSIIRYKGVFHIFHQFGQCGWAHAVSWDGAHWKNVRYPVIPDADPQHAYDACGCYDGSLTHSPDVNGGNPVILYDISPASPGPPAPAPTERLVPRGHRSAAEAPATTAAAAAAAAATNTSKVPLRSGDRPIQGVARPADLDDAELQYWIKDPANPVVGSLAGYPSQIWKNGNHWNYVADGRRKYTTDETLHSWQGATTGGGFPRGGSGGQWFQPLPGTVDGGPPPAGSPNYVISVSGGNTYNLGWYYPGNETYRAGPVSATINYGMQSGWAAMQSLQSDDGGLRMVHIAWLTSVPAVGSALSLLRELKYDAAIQSLVSNPMPELAILRDQAPLFAAAHEALPPGTLFTLPLPSTNAGNTVDVAATFNLDLDVDQLSSQPEEAGGFVAFAVGVFAKAGSVSESVLINVNVSTAADPATGWRKGTVLVGPENGSGAGTSAGCPTKSRRECWAADFNLVRGQTEVEVRVLLDRSIIEVFVAGGRVSGLVTTLPAAQEYSKIHLVASAMNAGPIAATNISAWGMGCGWNETRTQR